jgi:hypothetical protein
MMSYWDFFPTEEGWGRVPLWGFADVEASNAEGIEVGARFYGYLPPSSHLLVRPGDRDAAGFRDASEHRANLPRPYNMYASTTGDPAYEMEREDLQILYRPLFVTSFILDDFLADNDFFGAQAIAISSASSKTAYGTAFCHRLRETRPHLIGFTSPRNMDFTRGLGCYDEVVSYDDVTSLAVDRRTLYEDFAGDAPLRETLHKHLGDALVYDAIIGVTHFEAQQGAGGDLPGAQPAFFFAPDQIRKRHGDWGAQGFVERFGEAWREFAPSAQRWVEVTEGKGPEALRAAWLEVLSGQSEPRIGHVIAL